MTGYEVFETLDSAHNEELYAARSYEDLAEAFENGENTHPGQKLKSVRFLGRLYLEAVVAEELSKFDKKVIPFHLIPFKEE